ncbi:heavy metal-binding domain-containing protein [Ottowia sp.]|uniref:heavy metal-binding domain-containing protein n=1 Tax=Ottowia sp. TaxID=1898956 RepID=UPI002C6F560F|nr:heavy metal-binding domain-containing protein [Ottowia sp.]HMM72906.1 heavy metal-binding domain-containing protein [Rhodocyclaceae bacterium]HRN77543.1 heavy metal-binding domain-containing protein [Ottowia sp.]
MAWFSKSSDDFFLSTVVPQGQGGAQVAQFLGLVNGEAIIGANIFRDVFSSVRDVVGGRAGGYERALAGARDAALDEAKAAAKALGADGIVGIDFD